MGRKAKDSEAIREIVERTGILDLNNGGGAVTFEDVERTLEEIADGYGVKLWEVRQGTWEAITIEAGAVLFPPRSLKVENAGKRDAWDWALLDILIDWYITLSKKYGRLATPYAFGEFAGIPFDTFIEWCGGVDSSVVKVPNLQRLVGARDSAVIGKLYDSGQVTGQAMLANNLLGWDTSRNTKRVELARAEVATIADDLEALLGTNTNNL